MRIRCVLRGIEGMLEQAACNEILSRPASYASLDTSNARPSWLRNARACSRLTGQPCSFPSRIRCESVISAITRSLSFFSVIALDAHWFIALQASLKPPPSEVADHWTHGGLNLLAIIRLRNPQSANLVLQRRTLQSETLGGSPLACDPSRCGSQCTDDYEALACRNVEAVPKATLVSDEVASSVSGTSNSSPRVSMTARSMKLAILLIFPFHGQFVSISIARLGDGLYLSPHPPGMRSAIA